MQHTDLHTPIVEHRGTVRQAQLTKYAKLPAMNGTVILEVSQISSAVNMAKEAYDISYMCLNDEISRELSSACLGEKQCNGSGK